MTYRITFLCVISLLFMSCTQSIDTIERIGVLYVDAETGALLHGKYQSITPIGGTYSGNHESTFEYHRGVPVGDWTYVSNGDPIHSGKYLIENELKSKINSLTNAKRTDLDLWEEGEYRMLNIKLLFPDRIDSVSMKSIREITNQAILTKYNYKDIRVYALTDSTAQKVHYWRAK